MIRNPFDPIALSVVRGGRTLEDAVAHFLARCDALRAVRASLEPGELMAVRYEDLVADPPGRLAAVCTYLGVEAEPGFLGACAAIVRQEPERSRERIAWAPAMVAEVEERISSFDFLGSYRFAREVSA